MKKEHQSEIAIKRCLEASQHWEKFLRNNQISPEESTAENLQSFADYLGDERKIKPVMQGLSHYFQFLENPIMSIEAGRIRSRYLKRNVLKLKDFLGIPQEDMKKLRERGITDAEKILALGAIEKDRRKLARETGISYESILTLVKMSDLSRIFGLKGIRSRLYVDAGIDSVEKMSNMDPDDLIAITKTFIERTAFSGIPPTPKEAKFTIETAKKLLKIVDC